jgi:membrane-associated phospholipid phosphatase
VVPQGGLALTSLRPAERWLLAYLAFTGAMALVRLDHYPACRWVVVENLLVAAFLLLLARARPDSWSARLRELAPLLLLPVIYGQIDLLNGSGSAPVHDALVQHWELRLFSAQPSRDWWRAAPSAFWSTVLHAAYLSFYAIVFVPPLVALQRGDSTGARRAIEWTLSTFLICYVVFVLFPVAGPYYEFARPTGAFVGNFSARLVYGVTGGGSAYGAAFPSSHVAAAVTATGAALTLGPALGLGLGLLTLLMGVGTVYCQMHYAVDALAGLGVGVAVTAWKWHRWRREAGT